jgi:hypothetical protein
MEGPNVIIVRLRFTWYPAAEKGHPRDEVEVTDENDMLIDRFPTPKGREDFAHVVDHYLDARGLKAR